MRTKILIITLLLIIGTLSFVGCDNNKTDTIEDNHVEKQTAPESSVDHIYTYSVTEVDELNLTVAEVEYDGKVNEAMHYLVPNWFYPSIEIKVGDEIVIKHSGDTLKAYPLIFTEIYSMEYTDKETGISTVVTSN